MQRLVADAAESDVIAAAAVDSYVRLGRNRRVACLTGSSGLFYFDGGNKKRKGGSLILLNYKWRSLCLNIDLYYFSLDC